MIQKPEDRLSEWFRAAPLPDEPDSLHEFLARVPRENARPMHGSLSFTSLWPRRALAGLAAALVVAVIGGVLLFGLVSRGQTVPGGSPSAGVSATASGSALAPTGSAGSTTSAPSSTPTDAASPTPNTAWKASLPILTLLSSAIKTDAALALPAPDSVAQQVWGSRYYLTDWNRVIAPPEEPLLGATAMVRYADASTGKAGSVALKLTAAELAGMTNPVVGGGFSVAADGSYVAVVVWYRLQSGTLSVPCPSNYGSPIAWRILVAPLDVSTGAPLLFATVAYGHNQVAFRPTGGEGCDTVSAPLVALSGDLIAYNREAATADHPLASTILLHSLPGGAPDRPMQTNAMPVGLRVSGTNVAWLESDGNAGLPLRLSTADHPTPSLVDTIDTPSNGGAWTLPKFSLDGDRVAWEKYATNEVFVETIGGAATRISPSGVACLLGGSEAGQVLLMCYPGDPFLGNGDLAIWSSTAGLQLVTGYPAGANGVSWLSNGWIATEGSGYPSSGVTFVRLSDLAG